MQVQRNNAKKCKFQEEPPSYRPEVNNQMKPLPADPCPLLRPFCHQVGGHTQFLQLDQSTVCKPLIPRELSFYLNAPPDIRTFTPKCKGVIQTWYQEGRQYWRRFAMDEISVTAEHSEISSHDSSRHDAPLRISLAGHEAISYHPAHTYTDGSSQFFMMLENVASASKFRNPCVLDLKMGTRQHGDDASAEKRTRQMAKCAASTSASLGLRLCGMKVYDATTGNFVSRDKYFGRRLDADGLRRALVQFFASGGFRRSEIIDAILDRLRLLRLAVEKQETFRFYSSSLLIVYEGCDENPEFLSHPDLYFLNPDAGNGRRSDSDCELDRIRDDDHQSYNPEESIDVRSIVLNCDSQTLKRQKVSGQQPPNKLDFDSLSIADTSSEYFLTDSFCETQSFSTSPAQSVDSGLECYMMDQSSSSSSTSDYSSWTSVSGYQAGIHFKRLLRHSAPARTNSTGYECADNSADSIDSGLFSLAGHPQGKKTAMLKRSATISYTDSEEDSESDMTWQHHLDVQQHLSQPTDLSGSPPGEDEGELTPVLEVSRTDEFSDAAGGSQTQKKRRVMDEDKEEVLLDAASGKPNNCWSDCVDVRMIDFAHTTFSGYLGLDERVHWGPDNGYLLGLENLTDILRGLRGCSSYAHQKNTLCLSS